MKLTPFAEIGSRLLSRAKRLKALLIAIVAIAAALATPTTAFAASNKMLVFDQSKIDAIGKQPAGSNACFCYSYAFADTIVTGTTHYWGEYDENGGGNPYNAYGSGWSADSPAPWSRGYSTAQETYYQMWLSIENGHPSVVHVWNGGSEHWVCVVGYQNVTDTSNLSSSNFLIIDSDISANGGKLTPYTMPYSLYIDGYNNIRTWNSSVATTSTTPSDDPADIGLDFYACIIQQTSWTSVACGDTSPSTQLSISDTDDGRDPRRIFRFRRQLNGTYEISSAYWEGYLNNTWVVQPNNGSVSSGTIVNLGVSNSTVNQWWRISRVDAPMQLYSGFSSLALDVDSGYSLGTQLQLYEANSSSAQQFNIYKVEYNGWTYEKPGKPAASSYNGPTSVAVGESTTLTWTTSSLVNEWDRRSYDLTVTDSSGKVVLSQTGLTSTSYDYSFDEPGTYTVKVRANDTHYYQYYTDGPSKTITVTGEKDTTPPSITKFSIYNQTDNQITFDVQASDNVGVSEVYCILFTGLGTNAGKLSSGTSITTTNSDYVSVTKVGEGHWKFTYYLDNWGLVGDRHAVQIAAEDAAGNFSCDVGSSGMFNESRPTVYFDYQASPHVTLNLGDTITGDELFGGVTVNYYEMIVPLNMILTFDGYIPGTYGYSVNNETVFTATSVGTEPIVLINNKTAAKVGVVVTVVDSSIVDEIDISDASISSIPDQTYTGSAITPSIVVTMDGKTLTEGIDYTVSYSNNTNVGSATVTITGKGTYTGVKEVTFGIVAANISNASIGLQYTAATYTGSALKPTATVTMGGRTLAANTDYTVSYSGNTNKGTATVTVAGKGNYTGRVSLHFAITAADVAGATIAPIDDQLYAGSAIEPSVTVTMGGRTLVADSDYTVSYFSNTNVGAATVTVTGVGNYTGTKTTTFKIVAPEPPTPEEPFFLDADPSDTDNHGTEVDWMGRSGISQGWEVAGGREFRGLKDVTRCDFAAFLYRMADLSDNGVRDDSIALTGRQVEAVLRGVGDCTPRGTDHAAEVAWMISEGISKGWEDKATGIVSFRPYAKVARQDMAAFLYRYADLQDDGEQNQSLAMGPETISFSDVRHGDSANHADEVEWLASVGVTQGWKMKDGTYQFRGTKTVARQDMAAFMYRLYTYLNQ